MASYDLRPLYQQYILPRGARRARLLHITPADSRTALLLASISVCDLDDLDTAFEALSYVWGDQSVKKYSIVVNSHAVPVSENLASALCYLRTPDRPRCIWLDAICINQQDIHEKADQVAIMGDIYRRASCVNVWLPSPTVITTSLDTTVSLQSLFSHIASDHFHNIPGYSIDPKTGQLTFEETDEFMAAWEGFRLVAESPWWTRAWTAQEAILPSRLRFIYGNAEPCDFETISKAMDSYWRFWKGQQSCCSEAMALFPRSKMDAIGAILDQPGQVARICLRRSALERTFNGFDYFYIIVATFAARRCLEPRDRIYSLWSQAVNECYQDHTPSYSQPLEEVFTEVFKCMIREAQISPFLYSGVDFRVLFGPDFGPDAKRPSWVPSFVGGIDTESVEAHIRRLGCSRLFRASLWKKSKLRVVKNELHLDGDYINRILAVGLPVRAAHISAGCKDIFDQWRDIIRKTGVTISRQSLARLLCGDVYQGRLSRTRRLTENASFFLQKSLQTHWVKLGAEIGMHMMANNELWHLAEKGEYMRPEFDQFWSDGDFNGIEDVPYLRTTTTALMDRALYITEGGQIGLCWPHAKPGDEVWVVHGSKMPFVMRPAGMEYNLVGECYLQGAMDGKYVGNGTHIIII